MVLEFLQIDSAPLKENPFRLQQEALFQGGLTAQGDAPTGT